MAVHMPDIGANPNSGDILTPTTASKRSSTGDSFLKLLALATDNSQSPAAPLEPLTSPLQATKSREAHTPTKATPRPASKLSVNLTKANASYSAQHTPTEPTEAKHAFAKTNGEVASLLTPADIATPSEAALKASSLVSVSIPIVSYGPIVTATPITTAKHVSPVETTPTGVTAVSAPTDSVVARPTPFTTRSTPVTTPLAAGAISSAAATTHLATVMAASTPVTTSSSKLTASNPAAAASAAVMAPSIPGTTRSAVVTTSVSASIPVASSTVPQAFGKTAHQELSSPTAPAGAKGAATPTKTSAATSTAPDDDQSVDDNVPSAQVMTTLDNLIPVFAVGDQAQPSTTSPAVLPTTPDYVGSIVAPSLAYQQNFTFVEAATKPVTGATPTRHNDLESTYAPQTHQGSKSVATFATDTTKTPQPSPSAKEAAKTDEHPTSYAHSAVSSDRASQAPLTNNSSHGGKHDDSIAAQPGSKEIKATEQANGNPTADGRTGFSDAVAKVAGTIPAKEATVAAPSATPFSNSAGIAQTQSRKTDTDYSDQQPTAALPLGTIHSAKLVAQAAHSELRVGFHAGEFGNVDIRTSMVRSQLTAEISVEHGELRNLLAVELPHLQTKLADHPFTATNIALNSHTGGGSSNSRQAYQQNAQGLQGAAPRSAEPQSASGLTGIAESQVPTTQLDVHM